MMNKDMTRSQEQKESESMMALNEVAPKKRKRGQGIVDWANKVGRRNWVIVGAVLLIGLAVWLNWMFVSSPVSGGYADYDQSSGMSDDVGTSLGTNASEKDDYFATAQVNRKRARDESMAVLQSVIDSEDATEEVKNEALAEMNAIAQEIEKEANIEALLLSGGFEECVAVMNGNAINVIVKSQGDLQPAQIAKINTVVYEQTGIEPLNVTIVHKH